MNVKADKALLEPGLYQGYKCTLNYLFKRYKHQQPSQYTEEYMDGVVKFVAKTHQQNSWKIVTKSASAVAGFGRSPLDIYFHIYIYIYSYIYSLSTHYTL